MSECPSPDVLEMIKTPEEIQARVRELGATLTRDYEGKSLVAVAVLKGAVVFLSDLIRHIELPLTCDFIRVSSYGDRQVTSGVVKLELDLSQPVTGKHVLIVEDIVDTGLTLQYLLESMEARKVASVRVCALLHKTQMSPGAPLDYVGFQIPNDFVVGYGLDAAGRYRNLPYLAHVPAEPEASPAPEGQGQEEE